MKFNKVFMSLVIFATIFTVAGCSFSVKDEVSKAKAQVEQAFNNEPLAPNEKADQFSYHLPSNFEVQKELKNNVILTKGAQTYILFVNPEEDTNSKLMYDTLDPKSKKFILKSTFKEKNRFGYVAIKKLDDDLYETSVGVGGVKMTTDSKTSAISNSAQEMMNIVSSVQYEKK